MLKEERYIQILDLVNKKGTLKVSEIMNRLQVSDMTVRRDLMELEEQGKLERVHGGAKSLNLYRRKELTHIDKKVINIDAKKIIAEKALSLLKPEQTIFLGPGTTIELFASMITDDTIRVITNCLPVFEVLNMNLPHMQVYLLGGEIRQITKAFIGEITNKSLLDMHFHQVFVSSNAVLDSQIMTSTIEEGRTQSIALDNSVEKYLLIDDSKIGCEDFYAYYNLGDFTTVIVNDIESSQIAKIKKYVPIM